MKRTPVIVLFAPTATGKTALALNLFGKSSPSFFNGRAELISADSMQVYKGLDIGTAKPDFKEQEELKHHLIDVLEPYQQYNTADFVQQADVLCSDIYSRGRIPLVAGGTGFYIRNFLLGLPETPVSDEKVRIQLKERLRLEGKEKLHAELNAIDPESAAKINVNDEFRICRALEVFYTTGKPRSAFKLNSQLRDQFDFTVIILERDREELYQRINLRVEQMFESGLVEEIHRLYEAGARSEMPSMQAIGYREWFDSEGRIRTDLDLVKQEIQKDSRKYAKKQYTFMADIPGAVHVDATDEKKCESQVLKHIEHLF